MKRSFPILLAGGLAALACTQAHASIVRPAEFTCPITGRKFQALEQSSYYQRGMRLDTRPLGAVTSPQPLPVCPDESRLPLFKRAFPPEEVGKLKSIVKTAEYKAVRKRDNGYHAVAYLKEKLGDEEPAIAMAALSAVWEAENRKREVEFHLRYALDRFIKAAAALSPSERWATMTFLAAELSRRLGLFSEASERLARLEAGVAANGLKFPADLVARQRDLIARGIRTPEERR